MDLTGPARSGHLLAMTSAKRIRMRHLRCFMALAEHRSMTRAAEALNTVQPALSRTLRELESEIGQALFERTRNGLMLTLAGETFLRDAGTGLAQIERGMERASGAVETRSVSVGMLPNVARTLMPEATEAFKQETPQIDVRLYWATVPELVERLRRGDIDFLVGRMLSMHHLAGISFEHLYSEPLIFVARPDHRLAGRQTVMLEDIDNERVIVPLPDTIIRIELDRFTYARGLAAFSNKVESVSFEFTRACLETQDCVACMPLGTIQQELANGSVVRLAIGGDELISSVGMSFMTGRDLAPAAGRFADAVRNAARNRVSP